METKTPKTIVRDYTVTASEADTVDAQFEIDRRAKRIVGIMVNANIPNQAYYRGSQKVEFNGEEIFPAGFLARNLMSNMMVAPDDKFYPLNLEPGNRLLNVSYKDTDIAAAAFSAYTVTYTLKMEI